ncbi:MAG TPA: N-acetylneuraminate synthase [Methanophagales archaeon]|nr:N-acetylneuraminate synthase [Methanophagales archaeon]HJH25404.1 N-acetylneuraminate synthase [Methanophagales archaeon]
MKVKIGNKLIDEGEPCFIIAEAGVNHNGDIELAKKLIDAAKDAGADAVKFQTFKAENVVVEDAQKAEYQKETTGEGSQYGMLKKLELTEEDFSELVDYAKEKDILFLSSPFDKESVDLLYELDVPVFKVGSGEITNFPLLRYIAKKEKPVILSTGMATLGEVEEALNVIRSEGVEDVILLHCVSNYPAKIEDVNLRAMETLKQAFQIPVGFSDHTLGITMPIAAVALGACVIEKHFTLDRNLLGPDHKASLEPDELKEMVKTIRDVEKALGDWIKRPTTNEEEIKKIARRSVFAKIDISEGTVITEDMLDVKRPGTGIEPKYFDFIVGMRAKKDIKKSDIVLWKMIE